MLWTQPRGLLQVGGIADREIVQMGSSFGFIKKCEVNPMLAFALQQPHQDRPTQCLTYSAALRLHSRVIFVAENRVQVHIGPLVGRPGTNGTREESSQAALILGIVILQAL